MSTSVSIPESTTTTTQLDPSKKRKRRAPVAGAAEDCFACVKNGSKCDRRRPYCSQSLGFGNTCAGYPTTLTWGVGVASRGKLRGLSLPVPRSPVHNSRSEPVSPANVQLPSNRASYKRTFKEHSRHEVTRRRRTKPAPIATNLNADSSSKVMSASYISSDYYSTNVNTTGLRTAPLEQQKPRQYLGTRQDVLQHGFPSRHGDLFPLHTATEATFGDVPWPASTPSGQTTSVSFPMPDNKPIEDVPNLNNALLVNVTSPTWPHSQSIGDLPFGWHSTDDDEVGMAGTSRPRLSVAPRLRLREIAPQRAGKREIIPSDLAISQNTGQESRSSKNVLATSESNRGDALPSRAGLALPRVSYNLSLFDMPPRMSYLLDYYDKAICPVLVAFDGSRNPYRRHILDLATFSPGLQNAIGALATSNIRMRRLDEAEAQYRDQGAPNIPTPAATARGTPSPEEQHYKASSIDHLNTQLADPFKAKDDSVLATLVILCLFHACDSGFSKFKTQLAGVQKLLKLRQRHQQSEFVGWVEMFFAWFDVMTSAVNDRETQLRGDTLDLTDASSGLGEMEQFSGCDGRLFKLIARLGHLNLLSQSKPVHVLAGSPKHDAPAPSTSDSTIEPGTRSPPRDFYSLSEEYSCNDISQPDFVVHETLPTPIDSIDHQRQTDNRPAFWHQWRTLRHHLHTWQKEHTSPSPSRLSTLPTSQLDMRHLSESFLHSALLYTERLAYPRIASSHPNLQRLVRASLSHIAQISADSCVVKFMLWPMFVTGTECVNEGQRELIRRRVGEIQRESGFYNNSRGLEVLERVWEESETVGFDAGSDGVKVNNSRGGNDLGVRGTTVPCCGVQAFKWRKCMDRVDGEYIVI